MREVACAVRSDRLDELLDAARALANVGLQGSRDVAAVNRLLAGARDRLIDNSLANKGLRELVGAGARAEAGGRTREASHFFRRLFDPQDCVSVGWPTVVTTDRS